MTIPSADLVVVDALLRPTVSHRGENCEEQNDDVSQHFDRILQND